MPRTGHRVCLQHGLKLDINKLIREDLIQPGDKTAKCGIAWRNSYTNEIIFSGVISADLTDAERGWFRLQNSRLDQWIDLIPQPRNFGGRQWYFFCPVTDL